jgi:hypothetical protein
LLEEERKMQILSKLRAALAVLVLLGLAASATWADSAVSVFVGKSQVPGVVRGGRVFVPADEMFHAMGYTWSASGDAYTLVPGSASGPAVSGGPMLHVRLGDREAAAQAIVVKGKVWIDAGAATRGLGGIYVYTPAAQMAQASFKSKVASMKDLDRAVADAKAANKNAAATSSSADESGVSSGPSLDSSAPDAKAAKSEEGAKPADNEPIAVQRVSFSTNAIGLMKGSITLKNDYDKPIRNVFLYITMMAPDNASVAVNKNTGYGGTASVAGYVKESENLGGLGTYAGTPPTSVSSDYPGSAPVASGDPTTGYGNGPAAASPSPSPSPVAAASPSPEASASPTPVPMKPVATLPVVFVPEIGGGATLTVPFEWQNSGHIADVSPSVQPQHDPVPFVREKPADEDADKDEAKDKTDENADAKSDDKKADAKDAKSADGKKSDEKKADEKKSDEKSDDKKAEQPAPPAGGGAPLPPPPPPTSGGQK